MLYHLLLEKTRLVFAVFYIGCPCRNCLNSVSQSVFSVCHSVCDIVSVPKVLYGLFHWRWFCCSVFEICGSGKYCRRFGSTYSLFLQARSEYGGWELEYIYVGLCSSRPTGWDYWVHFLVTFIETDDRRLVIIGSVSLTIYKRSVSMRMQSFMLWGRNYIKCSVRDTIRGSWDSRPVNELVRMALENLIMLCRSSELGG